MAEIKRQTNLRVEMLLGALAQNQFLSFLGDYLKSLPAWIDDAERDFGTDIYERMLHDAAVGGSIKQIKIGVLANGPRIMSRINKPRATATDPEAQSRYDKAKEIKGFVEANLDRLQQPFEDILEEMLDALPFGHKLAEQTYEERAGRLWLKSLKVRPRKSYAFVVDKWMNLHGLLAATEFTGVASTLAQVPPESVRPREKFWIFSWASKGCDPRGTSAIRDAYNCWYLKQQCWPMYLKFLAQFGTPSIWGTTPENAGVYELADSMGNVQLDTTGAPLQMTAEESLLAELLKFANGTAIALPYGSELNIVEPKSNGEAYTNAVNLFDRQITRTILVAIRSVMESEHGSRADSQTAQDIVGALFAFVRRKLETSCNRQVIMPLVRYNYGDEAAESDLCPYLSLSDIDSQDVAEYGSMVADLAREDLIEDEQLPDIYDKLGLPEIDLEARMARKAEEREAERERRTEFDRLTRPVDEDEDDLKKPEP
jgi:hypothetical protein